MADTLYVIARNCTLAALAENLGLPKRLGYVASRDKPARGSGLVADVVHAAKFSTLGDAETWLAGQDIYRTLFEIVPVNLELLDKATADAARDFVECDDSEA